VVQHLLHTLGHTKQANAHRNAPTAAVHKDHNFPSPAVTNRDIQGQQSGSLTHLGMQQGGSTPATHPGTHQPAGVHRNAPIVATAAVHIDHNLPSPAVSNRGAQGQYSGSLTHFGMQQGGWTPATHPGTHQPAGVHRNAPTAAVHI